MANEQDKNLLPQHSFVSLPYEAGITSQKPTFWLFLYRTSTARVKIRNQQVKLLQVLFRQVAPSLAKPSGF